MKSLVASLAFLVVPVFSQAADIVEPFDVSAWQLLDNGAADNETIRHMLDTATGGSNFVWGGFVAGGATTLNQIGAAKASDALAFNANAIVPGSRAYTRFDTVAGITGSHIVNSVTGVFDGPTAGAKLGIYANPHAAANISVLLRDNTSWWQSSEMTIPANVTQSMGVVLRYPFSGTGAVTWTKVDSTTAGGLDMDEVDPKGESAYTLLTSGTPAFATVTGMGFVITSTPATLAATDLQIGDMTLSDDVVPPAAPVGGSASTTIDQQKVHLAWTANGEADLDGYNVYRATVAGGPYTKISGTTPLKTLVYDDTTVAFDTTYYYVVRAQDLKGNESANSTQLSAMAQKTKPLSDAKNWSVFK